MNSDGKIHVQINMHMYICIYSISEMFLLSCLSAVILFLNEEIFLWECSSCSHLIWQNLMVSAKHPLIIWYFTKQLSGIYNNLTWQWECAWLFSFDGWRTRSPERWSMLLQFKHLVSDKIRATPGGLPWMLVSKVKRRHRVHRSVNYSP